LSRIWKYNWPKWEWMWTDWGKQYARDIRMDLQYSFALDKNIKESNYEFQYKLKSMHWSIYCTDTATPCHWKMYIYYIWEVLWHKIIQDDFYVSILIQIMTIVIYSLSRRGTGVYFITSKDWFTLSTRIYMYSLLLVHILQAKLQLEA